MSCFFAEAEWEQTTGALPCHEVSMWLDHKKPMMSSFWMEIGEAKASDWIMPARPSHAVSWWQGTKLSENSAEAVSCVVKNPLLMCGGQSVVTGKAYSVFVVACCESWIAAVCDVMSHKEQCVLPLFIGEKHGGLGLESDLCTAENMIVTEHNRTK